MVPVVRLIKKIVETGGKKGYDEEKKKGEKRGKNWGIGRVFI